MFIQSFLLFVVLFFIRNEFVFRVRMTWLDKEGIENYLQCPNYNGMMWRVWKWSPSIEKWRR